MTKQLKIQVLQKVLGKAVKNGFNFDLIKLEYIEVFQQDGRLMVEIFGHFSEKEIVDGIIVNYTDIIFRHDFAKALWGTDTHALETGSEGHCWHYDTDCNACPCSLTSFCWEYKLQQLVLSKDHFEFLEQFV